MWKFNEFDIKLYEISQLSVMFVGNLSGRSIKLQPKMDKKESLKKLTFTKKTKHNFMRNRLSSPSFVKALQVRHTTNE